MPRSIPVVAVLALSLLGCEAGRIRGETPDAPLPETDPGPQLRRLTSQELSRSIQALLGPDVPVEINEPDPYRAGFARVGAREVVVSQSALERITTAVESAIDHVFAGANRGSALGCDPGTPTCATEIVGRLGPLAWRRPLTEAETGRLGALGASCAGSAGDPVEGARCVVSALLLSPNFLYRVELPRAQRYYGYAMASRLAYFLWSAPPDEALLQAAANGELDTARGVRQQAERMLDDPRAREGLGAFVSEWYRLDRLGRLERDVIAATDEDVQFALQRDGRIGSFRRRMSAAAGEELRRLVVSHVLDDDRDYIDLLSTDRTFVNAELELFYNVRPEDEGWPGALRAPGYEDLSEGDDEDEAGFCVEDCEVDCEDDCGDDDACWDACTEECIAVECEGDGGEGGSDDERPWLVAEGAPDADGWRRARHTAASPRRGILGTMAVLSQLGKQQETSPTRRGLYVMEHVLCLEVGEPPDNIDVCPRPEEASRRSSIEDHHVCAPSCAGCHTQMDPLGFALDEFDTIGRFRTVDDWGYPIDADVTWTMASGGTTRDLRMDGLDAMVDTFRSLPEVERCVARQIYRFATGAKEPGEDAPVIDELGRLFQNRRRKLRGFIVQFVGTDAFRAVPAPEDLGPIPATVVGVGERIFAARCAPCHVGQTLGGLDLSVSELASRLRGSSSIGMPLVTPGDPSRSYLWHKVNGTHGSVGGDGDRMPPGATSLSTEELAALRQVIEENR